MGFRKVVRCKICGKIYSCGIPEVCCKCGTKIANKDGFLEWAGHKRCMVLTSDAEEVAAKRTLHGWKIKQISNK